MNNIDLPRVLWHRNYAKFVLQRQICDNAYVVQVSVFFYTVIYCMC